MIEIALLIGIFVLLSRIARRTPRPPRLPLSRRRAAIVATGCTALVIVAWFASPEKPAPVLTLPQAQVTSIDNTVPLPRLRPVKP